MEFEHGSSALSSSSSSSSSYSSSSSSSPILEYYKYDVFVSFRGKDSRWSFTDHLYAAFQRKGIIAFKDDQELERGDSIPQTILQAIQHSRFSVIIFSRDYASSTWCLDELSNIFQCFRAARQTIFPVFRGVDASQVRKQTGRIGKAFAKHEKTFEHDLEKVQKWRYSMTEIANLSGWDLQNRSESEVIQEIVEELWRKLNHRFSTVNTDVVGIDCQVDEICRQLVEESGKNIRVLGIHGMGGIGKTTVARVVYGKISHQFEGSSFLANVRDVQEKHGLVSLQEQLLSEILMETKKIKIWNVDQGMNEIRKRLCHKRVLIVLDDADKLDQFKALAGMRDWFGSGSRIIITTRDEHVAISCGADKLCRIKELDHEQALQLFSLKAFKNEYPKKEYAELSDKFLTYANGLPLALVVIGSFLFGRSVSEWRSALDRLKKVPQKEILDKLQISFDGLEELEKKMFLDIACFFNGKKRAYVLKVLECCALYPDIGIRVLIDKSLVTVSDDRIWMHDLLQEMGREIVKQNSYENPGKRRRVWLYEDIEHVLKQNEGMEEIEGIVLELEGSERGNLSTKAFLKMKKLRFLILRNCHCFESVHHLPDDQLQYLEWNGYPSKSLPPSFQPDKLVELNLRHSHIEQLWKNMKAIKPLQNLKLIDLSHCQSLRKTPDFRWFPNLEIVKLERCTRLRKVHDSIGTLRDLVSLNLKDCTNLVGLPSSIRSLKSLKNLILSGCSKLEKLPERLQNLTCLEVLDLGKTAVRQLPPYLKLSKSLQVLSFHGCNEPQRKSWDLVSPFRTLPRNNPSPVTSMLTSLLDFCHLKILDLSNCNLTDGAIPDHLSCFIALETLNLSGNDFFSLPASIRQLSNLEVLIVDNCKKLESLPELPLGIKYVSMYDCESLTDLPSPLEAGKPSKEFRLVFSNSHKLNQLRGNDGFSFVLDRLYFLLKNWPQEFYHFFMCCPGRPSPAWFNYSGMGSAARLQLPPTWCDGTWKGLAVSAVYVVDEDIVNDDKKLWNEDDDFEFPRIQCFVQPNTEKASSSGSSSNHPLTLLLTRDAWLPGFVQHWFIYIPQRCYGGGVELWNNIDVRFSCRRLTVKKCGVRLVYEQDVEELDPCKIQQHKANNSITFIE